MTITRILLFTLLFSFVATASQAQFGRLKRKIQERLERKLEDKAVDKVEEEIDKELAKDKARRDSIRMAEGEQDIDIEIEADDNVNTTVEPNEQICSFIMKMEESKNGKPTKNGASTIHYVFDEYQTGLTVATEDGETRMIMNHKEKTITTITEEKNGKNQGVKMKQPRMRTTIKDKSEDADITVTKTDETKTINGYNCTKYIIEDNDQETTTTAWITTEVDIDYVNLISNLNTRIIRGKSPVKSGSNIYGIEGFPIQFVTVDGKKETKMEILEIKEDAIDRSVFDVSGIKIQDMSNFGF